MSIEEIKKAKVPVYVVVMVDGREYQGEVRGKNKNVPFVFYETGEGCFCPEFSWSAIERAVNEREVLLG